MVARRSSISPDEEMMVPFNSSGCDSSITFRGSSLGPRVDGLGIAVAAAPPEAALLRLLALAVPDRLLLLLVASSVVEFISLLTVGLTEGKIQLEFNCYCCLQASVKRLSCQLLQVNELIADRPKVEGSPQPLAHAMHI